MKSVPFRILVAIIAIFVITINGCFSVPEDRSADGSKSHLPKKKASHFEGIDHIKTDNDANRDLSFYYYMPSAIMENEQSSYPALIMIPPLSKPGKSFVSQPFRNFADKNSFIIIAPSFIWDKKNWETKTSYQYPSVWSGDALLSIIERVEEKNGISISELYLFGFSAGAQFALRFCLWRPELCAACAAHGSGGTVLCTEWIDVKFLVTVGTKDMTRIEKAKAFYESAQNNDIDVLYKEFNTGHSLTPDQINESLDFFENLD
jgi:poly(3-hydroxybutyrate) depolymerase